tara:strand:+ start:2695 stop:3315 length:621 start_codon:yes stop_codon:yes gene_type:complete
MKERGVKKILLINALIFFLIALLTNAHSAKLTDIQEGEWILGNIDAPITMIEYASLSCPHCAAFHIKTLPTIKKEYIDTGKVKLIFRHFPFNLPALQGSMITKCVGEDLYFKYLEALFSLQKKWVKSEGSRESLFNIMSNTGMTREEFDECLNNKDIENKILSNQIRAHEEYNIKTTPSFIINGKLIEGNKSIDTFRKTFDSILSN